MNINIKMVSFNICNTAIHNAGNVSTTTVFSHIMKLSFINDKKVLKFNSTKCIIGNEIIYQS